MKRVLDCIIVAAAAALFVIAGIGGVEIDAGGVSIRARDWLRPAIALVFGLAARAILAISGAGENRPSFSTAIAGAARRGLLALIVAAGLAYLQYHVRVAGGLDSYGYVSTARLIASGRLHEPQPLAAVLPFPDSLGAATPLGHVPAPDGHSSVPRFPIGLPVIMALFTVFSASGPFFVPLVMAYAALLVAYSIGRESTDRLAGLLAASLVALNPVFAVSAIQPMSDVPAACWLLAAIWAGQKDESTRSPLWSVASGISAGMTVLTRPVLLPAVVVFLLVSTDKRRLPFALTRAATVLAFLVLQVWLNVTLYGTATMSGYGSASHMFDLSASRLAANLSNFGKWSMYSGTALLWLAWPVSLAVLRHERKAWELSAIGAAAAAPYLFYLVFDNWDASRFLLPTIVLALILCARALTRIFSMTRSLQPWRPVATFGIALVCAFTSRQFLQREGIGQNQSMEAKYPLVGEWFRNNTSDRAVVLSSLHSGAIRMYGERQTIRWDYIPANALDQTIDQLVDSGYEPYLALDLPSEPPLFEERFGSESVNAEPIARVRVVNIYKFVSAR